MIKASERKISNSTPECHADSGEPALGIAFEQRTGRKRFLPYPLLSAVDFHGKSELTFHFGADRIVAKGENLEPLWIAVCKGRLERVWESEKVATGAPEVRQLVFVDSEPDHLLDPFPGSL